MSHWRYDTGTGVPKHKWGLDKAGFKPSGRGPVGYCPKSLTTDQAARLLNNGFPVYENGDPCPARIYNIYKGVVYEARRTEYGKSFHGFPWRGDRSMASRLPARIYEQLENRARENDELREFKKWIKTYGKK